MFMRHSIRKKLTWLIVERVLSRTSSSYVNLLLWHTEKLKNLFIGTFRKDFILIIEHSKLKNWLEMILESKKKQISAGRFQLYGLYDKT